MSVQTVGVVGLGLMGRGIVASLIAGGLEVIAYDIESVRGETAREQIAEALREISASEGPVDDATFCLTTTSDLSELSECEFLIESVPEDLSIKRRLLEEVTAIVPESIPIASNTSAIPISLLQQDLKNPARFVGMHWAEPCHLTRFLEIIRGDQTDDASLHCAEALGRRLGKDPVLVQRDVSGFIVNRLAYAMYREAFWLLENEVADVESIDRAFVNAISVWANIAGPFRWMDLTGLPVYAETMDRLFPELSRAREAPSHIRELVREGARGIENGRGFYNYSPDEAEMWRKKWIQNVERVAQLRDDLDADFKEIM